MDCVVGLGWGVVVMGGCLEMDSLKGRVEVQCRMRESIKRKFIIDPFYRSWTDCICSQTITRHA
jgi:hypothetical protein